MKFKTLTYETFAKETPDHFYQISQSQPFIAEINPNMFRTLSFNRFGPKNGFNPALKSKFFLTFFESINPVRKEDGIKNRDHFLSLIEL
jgi:hypothetical protein